MRQIAKVNVYTKNAKEFPSKNGVPGVLCRPDQAPVAVAMKKREVMRALRSRGRLMELSVDSGKPVRGCFKAVQFDEGGFEPEYITIEKIHPGNEIHFSVPIVAAGKPRGFEKGIRARQQLESIKILGLARDLPKIVTVDVRDLAAGDVVLVRDLELPPGTTYDPEASGQVVFKCEEISI